MTVELFRQRLERAQLHPNDLQWMPKWLEEYAAQQDSGGQSLQVTEERVFRFLRSLRDRGVPAWQRLQAARTVEWYQAMVLCRTEVDFSYFKLKLGELAEVERRCGTSELRGKGMPGEGQPGMLDPAEPEAARALRARMRVLHHPKSTEEAYVGWLLRFIRHLDDDQVQNYGEPEIGQFLTDLAVVGEVAAGTQNQALSALLFNEMNEMRSMRARDVHVSIGR